MEDLTAALARIEVLEAESAQMRARLEDCETVIRVFGQSHQAAAPARHLSLVRPA